MDVDCVMLLIAFDVHTEIEGDTPEIMHPEHILHLVLHLQKHPLVSKDEKIIDLQNTCGNDYVLILIMEHEQSTINM